MLRLLRTYSLLIVGLILCHCDDDSGGVKTQGPDDNPDPDANQRKVLVVNEGNFNSGNASLGIYYPDSGSYTEQVFQGKTGRPLGDVFQSVAYHNQKVFLVVNNSGKVEVLDSTTLSSVGVIDNLPSPRYLQPVGNGRAYLTNFTQSGQSEISIVDLQSLQKTSSIKTGGWTGNPTLAAGRVWVPEVKAGWVLAIDPSKDKITDTIRLRKEIQQVVKDTDGQLWALANGGIDNSVTPALYQIDPMQKTVRQELPFTNKDAGPGNLTLNNARDTIYYTTNGIYRMPVSSNQLPAEPLVTAKDRNFYGLALSPDTSIIYASDPKDYVQRGIVYRFNSSGALIDQFKAGIIPRDFVFY